jgi:putative transposase
MKFHFIEDQREAFPVRVMCDVMGVSPAGYYAWRRRPESCRKAANRALLAETRRLHLAHRGRYGAPRIHVALRGLGHMASRGRIERLMRHHGIRARAPRRFRIRTTGWIDCVHAPRGIVLDMDSSSAQPMASRR